MAPDCAPDDGTEAGVVYIAMVRCEVVVVLGFILGMGLAGCGGGNGVKFVGHTIEVGQHVSQASLVRSVLGIRVGTKASRVRARLGAPFTKVGSGHQTCWVYHAHQQASSLDAIDFCIGRNQRVERIVTGVHG
jgi:hypothetical protein